MDYNAKKRIHDLWVDILEVIGEDPGREGLLGTPGRVAEMYGEIFSGYHVKPPWITVFKNDRPGGLIIDKGYFYSFCEHHVVPFFGDYLDRRVGAFRRIFFFASSVTRR